MKKTILVVALLISGFVFQTATAQLQVSLRANIGNQPIWGPVGYDRADYYYMPDIDVFYQISTRQYIYQQRGRWVFARNLPFRYRDFDVYKGYKVVVNERSPYRHADSYRAKYASYKGRHDQEVIRNSHDSKYFEIKNHPEHSKWNDHNHRG